jgi:G3E family GTPase
MTSVSDSIADLFGAQAPGRTPVFLVTGFLGSGKTTLIREMLAHPGMSDTALIINEFGEVGLDHILVQSAIENVLLLENGCVCCSIRGDLIDTVGDLFAKAQTGAMPAFSRIIIETTGLADPGPIVQELLAARGLSERIRLEKVIVTVDGVLGSRQIQETEEVTAQVAQADLCLVTKCDLVDRNVVNALIDDLHDLNPTADVIGVYGAGIDIKQLLARPSFDMPRSRVDGGIRCEGGEVCTHPPGTPCQDHPGGFERTRRSGSDAHRAVQSWSTRLDRPLSWPKVRDWLDFLYSMRPANMLRMKGILHLAGQVQPVVIHGVGAVISDPIMLDRWPGRHPLSEIVVITKDLGSEMIGRSFEAIVLDATTRDVEREAAGAAPRPIMATLSPRGFAHCAPPRFLPRPTGLRQV